MTLAVRTLGRGEDLDGIADTLHIRRPDEHCPEWRVETFDLEIGFEAGQLTAERVSSDAKVNRGERTLIGTAIHDFRGEQNHAGARSECRSTIGQEPGNGVEQT